MRFGSERSLPVRVLYGLASANSRSVASDVEC